MNRLLLVLGGYINPPIFNPIFSSVFKEVLNRKSIILILSENWHFENQLNIT
jgi:hypothetical protein